MASFSTKDIQSLRQKTGVGILDCKDALEKANGDIDKAIYILREKGIAKAAKKADRVAAEGIVLAKIEGEKGVLLEINSETDFVAKNEKFQNLANEIAETILENSPNNLDELGSCKIKDKNLTVTEAIQEGVLVLGENIKVRRFALMNGVLSSYIHANGNIGVMVKFETDLAQKDGFSEYARNVAMHIAAAYSKYLDSNSVPSDVLEKEKQILEKQMADSNKPANIVQKIVEGKLNKFYEEFCLLNQKYVKNDELTILKYSNETAKELNGSIKIVDFIRMEKGEGVQQKNSTDFASEVASMIKGD